jgi:predicted enzyme related to lactoylglutathione lyase
MPVESMRAVRHRGIDAVLAEHRDRLQAQADTVQQLITTVDRYLEAGLPVKTSRIAQVTIVADDLATSIAFYRDAFDAAYHEEISSFQFGAYPDDDFFLLTVANPRRHAWPGGPAKFGLLVENVDAAHARSLAAGGVEVQPPIDQPWKPRSSTVQDPGGNHIDLFQG